MTDQCHSALEQPEIWRVGGKGPGTRLCSFCGSRDAVGWIWLASLREALLNQAVCLPHDSSLGSKKWSMGAAGWAEEDW